MLILQKKKIYLQVVTVKKKQQNCRIITHVRKVTQISSKLTVLHQHKLKYIILFKPKNIQLGTEIKDTGIKGR